MSDRVPIPPADDCLNVAGAKVGEETYIVIYEDDQRAAAAMSNKMGN